MLPAGIPDLTFYSISLKMNFANFNDKNEIFPTTVYLFC